MDPFETWLQQQGDAHGDAPQAVADQLAASLHRVGNADQAQALAALAAHVFGEHLGQWQRGIDLLDALPAFDGSAAATVARLRAVLGHLQGDAQALQSLAGDARVAALAQVASMATGRSDLPTAIAALREALALAGPGLLGLPQLPEGSPAWRALAVAGNNLAATLEELPQRSDDQVRAMVQAAHTGLIAWRRAGGWLEEERAAYRLARSQLLAGLTQEALTHARLCTDICEARQAPPFEQFFAHAVTAMALRAAGDGAGFIAARARAQAARAQVADDERAWCDADWQLIAKDGP